MPFATASDGTRLAYSVSGPRSGEPLLMIQGLGADRRGWAFQRRTLAERYRVILFDNRGVGGSDRPPGPYDLEVMAADAAAVLDAAGVASAHVMGASMGGAIAQLLAFRSPERVRSLVLACTACQQVPWRRDLLADWAHTAETRGTGALVGTAARWVLHPRSYRRFGAGLRVLRSLLGSTPAPTFVAQVEAILAADDTLRIELAAITVPTLVLVGSQDILTPLADSEELVALIPGAELQVIRGGAHGFMVEQAPLFNRAVRHFLHRVTHELERDERAAS